MTAEALDGVTVRVDLNGHANYSFDINTHGGLVDPADVERIAQGVEMGLREVGFEPVVTRKYARVETQEGPTALTTRTGGASRPPRGRP